MIPKVLFQAWTSPLNPRLLYQISYTISLLRCLVGISNMSKTQILVISLKLKYAQHSPFE